MRAIIFRMETTRSAWLLPGAIIGAGALLAIAIFIVRDGQFFGPRPTSIDAVRPVDPAEHIIGNPKAEVIIIEYADIDSSYAKEYQRTLGQLMSEYGSNGKVAWVYRHFPLINKTPNSLRHAEAAECVASLGNKAAFFKFIDLIQANAPDEEQFDPANYPLIIERLGVDQAAFNACVAEGRFAPKVAADFENALESGATASPYSVILIKGKDPMPINGAIPYATLKRIVDSAS